MGSNLEIFDPVVITEWNDLCGKFGMDTITMGDTLVWVMEAGENGMIKTDLKFGLPEGIATAMEDIASGRGFGKEMGRLLKEGRKNDPKSRVVPMKKC
jgi:aldehyde:ferredoxin oxidoreductase